MINYKYNVRYNKFLNMEKLIVLTFFIVCTVSMRFSIMIAGLDKHCFF